MSFNRTAGASRRGATALIEVQEVQHHVPEYQRECECGCGWDDLERARLCQLTGYPDPFSSGYECKDGQQPGAKWHQPPRQPLAILDGEVQPDRGQGPAGIQRVEAWRLAARHPAGRHERCVGNGQRSPEKGDDVRFVLAGGAQVSESQIQAPSGSPIASVAGGRAFVGHKFARTP
jgi:hypothetical protein